jgi:hypothetical protein
MPFAYSMLACKLIADVLHVLTCRCRSIARSKTRRLQEWMHLWGRLVTDRPNSASTQQPTTYHLQRTTYNVPPTTYHLQRTTYNVPPTTYHLQRTNYNVHLSTSRLPTPLPGYTVPNTMGHSYCPRHIVQHTMCCPFPSYPSVHNRHHTM